MKYLKIYIFSLTLEDTIKTINKIDIFHVKLVCTPLARAKITDFKTYKKVDTIGTTSRHQSSKNDQNHSN